MENPSIYFTTSRYLLKVRKLLVLERGLSCFKKIILKYILHTTKLNEKH